MESIEMHGPGTPKSPDPAQGEPEQLLQIIRLAKEAGWTVVVFAEDELGQPSGNVLMVLPGRAGMAIEVLQKYLDQKQT